MQDLQLRLVEQALASFETGDLAGALAAIERACRIHIARPEHLLLRGVILDDLGHHDLAELNLREASAMDPSNLVMRQELLRRVAPRLEGEARSKLAREVVGLTLDGALLDLTAAALAVPDGAHVGVLRRRGERLEIGVLGDRPGRVPVTVSFDDGAVDMAVPLQPINGGASRYTHRGEITLDWQRGASKAVCSSTVPITWLRDREVKLRQAPSVDLRDLDDVEVCIILPLYKDARMSARCIVSLLTDLASTTRWRLIIVNDASPEPQMAEVLSLAERDARVRTVRLPINSGFIAAVNAGLALSGRTDVILLNSDTLVGPGWIDRLRAAALSDERIGTATPLSNNGETVSVPSPFTANPMPSAEEVASLDGLAARANAGQVVSLPSGMGFALYIRRACLDAVGFLDDHGYQDGYLEEVDFCLRAKAAGFINVCATDVYVGHVGNVSFGERKRGLVAINGAELGRRYPSHEAHCRLFVDADPLRHARDNLQAAWLRAAEPREPVTLIVSSATHLEAEPLRSVISRLKTGDQKRLVVLTGNLARTAQIIIDNPDGGLPHRAAVPCPGALDWRGLQQALPRFDIARLCLADLGPQMEDLLRSVDEVPCPIEVVIGDASAICARHDLLRGGDTPCGGEVPASLCSECLALRRPVFVPADLDVDAYRSLRRHALEKAVRIYAEAGTEAGSWPGAPARLPPPPPAAGAAGSTPPVPAKGRHLAIIPIHRSVPDFEHLLRLVEALSVQEPAFGIVILGTTLDDGALLRHPRVTVTGPADPAELPSLLHLFGCGPILLHQFATEFFLPWFDAAAAAAAPLIAPDTFGFRALKAAGTPLKLVKHDKSAQALANDIAQIIKSSRSGAQAGA